MTPKPEIMASEIKKRWEVISTELVRCKRLNPDVYEKVVSTLAQVIWQEDTDTQ